MSRTISPSQLSSCLHTTVVIDVRKDPARRASMLTIPSARCRSPFAAETWWPEFGGQSVVVFCVHGHEVSRAVAGFLNDNGVDAQILEGGFEAWRAAGHAVVAIEASP
jgi:rhodanese-related sulfurtransferase